MSNQLSSSKFNEYATVVCSLILGSLMVWYVYSLDLIKALTDANAHLNFSRMLFDSMTPGVSQIGFWPPLLHILLAPFTGIKFLYETGLAAAFVLMPFYAMGALFTYKLAWHFTKNFWLSFFATAIYMVNPYILYYSAVPMMEVMFLANLLGAAYFTAKWLERPRLSFLVLSGVFVALAGLSRFEGLLLIPVVGAIVLIQLVRTRKNYAQTEAVMILFSLVAVIGAVFITVYSWVFGGTPLAFTGGDWFRSSLFNFATRHNVVESIQYVLQVSYYMLSEPLVLLSLASFALLLLISKKRFEMSAVLAILAVPAVFVAIALFSGSYQAAVPSVPPYNIYLNERYGLTWIGFVILAPVMLLGSMFTRSKRNQILKFASVTASLVVVATMSFYSAGHLKTVAFDDKFIVISNNINAPRIRQHKDVANYMKSNYDFGKVLITRADNDPILANAGIDLKNYIYEGNYLYFDQTMKEPWIFARWVVMHNPEDVGDSWSLQNDTIVRDWGSSEEFNRYYDLVMENSKKRVYKINEEMVAQMTAKQGLKLSEIPSVNENIQWWNTSNIYAKIQDKFTAFETAADTKKN